MLSEIEATIPQIFNVCFRVFPDLHSCLTVELLKRNNNEGAAFTTESRRDTTTSGILLRHTSLRGLWNALANA